MFIICIKYSEMYQNLKYALNTLKKRTSSLLCGLGCVYNDVSGCFGLEGTISYGFASKISDPQKSYPVDLGAR